MADKLESLSTSWTLIQQAHAGSDEESAFAHRLLLERYHAVVYRYLLGITKNADLAADLAQEFGLALVEKRYWKASPANGRFRDYIKTVLRHLVHHHFSKSKREPKPLAADQDRQLALLAGDDNFDCDFAEQWRDQLLARAWDALSQARPDLHRVLRFRADHPELRSGEMAQPLGELLGKPMSAANARQALRRARKKFGDLLVHEVACSLEKPTIEFIEEELQDLRLMDYCAEALQRYRQANF